MARSHVLAARWSFSLRAWWASTIVSDDITIDLTAAGIVSHGMRTVTDISSTTGLFENAITGSGADSITASAAEGGQVRVKLHRPEETVSETVILGTGAEAAAAVVDVLDELGVL